MGAFIQGFLQKEFENYIDALDDEELAIIKAVTHYELYTSEQIKDILRQRVQQVLRRLGKGPPGS
jgi:hypothetical protein